MNRQFWRWKKSQIGDARVQDCLIDNVHAPNCPALVRVTGTMANVDELDWLGKQLESFDRYELLQFNAAVERFGLSAADELIDLSFCAREVTVISDFNDLELVGKRHYLTVHGACDPKELENLDGKETALALISGQPGYVTRYGVVYDNGMKLDQAYDRKHLPPIWMPESCILELKIRATGEDDPKKQEWVQLPTSRIKLERAMLRVGIASCGEMQMLVADSRFPDEVDCTLDVEHGSLFELNQLCQCVPISRNRISRSSAQSARWRNWRAQQISASWQKTSINLISHQMSTRRRNLENT